MKRLLLLLSITFFSFNTFAQPAEALNFDGVNDYVNLGSHSALNYTSSSTFTIEFWMRFNSTANQSIVSRSYRDLGRGWTVKVENNIIYFRNRDFVIGNSATTIPQNTWTHIAVTYNNTAVIIYINGVQRATGSVNLTANTGTYDMILGGRHQDNGALPPFRHFSGSIDDLRFWSVARTATQILNSKDCALVGTETNLVSYFKFNQGNVNQNNTSQTTLINTTNSVYNGTLVNFTLTGTASNFSAGSGIDGCTLSVGDYQFEKDNIKIFPNPSNGIITIKNSNSISLKELFIEDINGKQVFKINLLETINQNTIDVSVLQSGIYVMTINTEGNSIRKKLIIK